MNQLAPTIRNVVIGRNMERWLQERYNEYPHTCGIISSPLWIVYPINLALSCLVFVNLYVSEQLSLFQNLHYAHNFGCMCCFMSSARFN